MPEDSSKAPSPAAPSQDELEKFWGWIKTGDARVEAAAAFLDRYPQAVTIPLVETDDWSMEAGILPLHYAAKEGDDIHSKMVDLLIRRGAPVNGRDLWERTPLHLFTTWNPRKGIETMRLLLDNGADPDARNNRQITPLLNVAEHSQDPEQARLLLDAGANPNIADDEGRTPLWAIMANTMQDHTDVRFVPQPGPTAAFVKALLAHGARTLDAAPDGNCALVYAKKCLYADKRLKEACNAVLDRGRAENAEGVAREATQLATTGTQRKTRALPRITLKRS